ncbi:hypothetical protein BD626DRAFT_505706 [Schizophyllum amplum]|uniref:Fungal-specific transcription factor domain-containing protein n=1 Tax=Schizophyllum amplum TaxID=97359 RepID=A0A550C5U1_9AGAR|nr:hypothetical protein BD626DRAFT_505706 [Auriculariopsis ampla]
MKVTDKDADKRKNSLSCAECRRSKIACDRSFPCQSCIKRGCAAICPNGTMPATKGNKVLLAHSQRLGDHVKTLQSRVRELEAALAASQDDHPLLQPEQVPSAEDDMQRVASSIGMLSIGSDGQARYQGDTAATEFISDLLNEEENDVFNVHALGLPTEIIDLINAFPFGLKHPSMKKDIFLPFVPTRERAEELVRLYYEHEAWMFCPITRADFDKTVLQPLYSALEQDDIGPVHAHKLSLFFAMIGVGALFDKTDPNGTNWMAPRYIYLSRGVLSFHSMLQEVTCATVQAVFLIVRFMYRTVPQQRRNEERWVLLGLCSRLASIIGLQRDSAGWELEHEEVERRRLMFWELYTYETAASLANGRPPSLMIQHADTKFPVDLERDQLLTSSDNDMNSMGFHAFKHRYSAACLSSVANHIFSTRLPHYKSVLELDKRIRNFPMPAHLRSPAVLPVTPGCEWAEEPSRAMQQYCVVVLTQGHLLYIHRSYAGAALQAEGDPMSHSFAPSVLAVYRSSCQLIEGVQSLMKKHPEMLSECWFFWSNIYSACMVLATIVIQARDCSLASDALKHLELAVSLFERGSHTCRPPTTQLITHKMLDVSRRHFYHELEAVDDATKQELCLLGNASMRVVRKDANKLEGNSSSGSPQDLDWLDPTAPVAGPSNPRNMQTLHGMPHMGNGMLAGLDFGPDIAQWEVPGGPTDTHDPASDQQNPSYMPGNDLTDYAATFAPGVDQFMFGQTGWSGTTDVQSYHQGPMDVGALAGRGMDMGMGFELGMGVEVGMDLGMGMGMGLGMESDTNGGSALARQNFSRPTSFGGLAGPSQGGGSSNNQHFDPTMGQYDVQGSHQHFPAPGEDDDLTWGTTPARMQTQRPPAFM